ncbi:hypothetical protein GCM10025760_25820 [Microbacterium yannicii]|uniref:Phage shock protein PspC N-terminal domain-containing protein n=1 Tax=Microbacterium yannicii TaxID=671622 RepID=A0ABP9MI50_9MICO|nr:PspC domain-containing protein [Microbacterium yannicii]MCO5952961.1 PspC domain-containing protein [Microbacterium yannicii]
MTDTASAPPTDPGPPPPAPPGVPKASERFFDWVRGLGVARGDAWLGGVCGGIAARLRIDPLIVRGIFVVVALLGFPALLVYAIAWALLPDAEGRIHLRELFYGRYDPAMTGVFILAAVGFIPVVPWLRNLLLWPVWAVFGGYPSSIWDLGSPWGGFGVIIALAVIGLAVYFIVRSARADRSPWAGAQRASAQSAPPAASHSGDDATAPLVAAAAGVEDSAGRAPAESATGAAVADDAQVSDWRARQEAWRTEHHSWQRSQQDAARAAREQARRERETAGSAFALEAEERRRIRQATRPRTSFVFVLTALGAALVAGSLAVLATASLPFAGAVGVFTAALVTALAMVVAGVARRRSGFLTAVTLVLLVVGVSAAAASGPDRFAVGDVNVGTATYEQVMVQPFGSTYISVDQLSGSEDVRAGGVVLTKGTGGTDIAVYPGTSLDLDATLGDGVVVYTRSPGSDGGAVESGTVEPGRDGTLTWSVDNELPDTDAVTTQHITLDQRTGSVQVTIYEK